MLAAGFRAVQPVPGIEGMCSTGLLGYQYHPKIPDPTNPAVLIPTNPPGFWYYVDPHAMKRYTMVLLNTLKVHHITNIVTGDRLIMEQVINRVGEGYNLSTAIVDTLDSTTMTQLLAATGLGRFPIRRGVGQLETQGLSANRGTKRAGDARVDKTGKAAPKPPAGPTEYRPGMDPCLKYSDGLCNDFSSRGRGCNRPDCRYKHFCRACGSTDGHGAATCAKRQRR